MKNRIWVVEIVVFLVLSLYCGSSQQIIRQEIEATDLLEVIEEDMPYAYNRKVDIHETDNVLLVMIIKEYQDSTVTYYYNYERDRTTDYYNESHNAVVKQIKIGTTIKTEINYQNGTGWQPSLFGNNIPFTVYDYNEKKMIFKKDPSKPVNRALKEFWHSRRYW